MRQYEPNEEIQIIKTGTHVARPEQTKQKQYVIRSHLNSEQSRTNDLNQETGASAWLTTLTLKQEGYALTKQLFWDLIRIRYGWQLSRTPKFCKCVIRFSLQYALSCKKGGFVSIRHDVELAPPSQPLTGEELCERSAVTTDETSCDVSARGFFRCKGIQPKHQQIC